jgi:20S proteasome alpha/beta subunit
VVTRAAAAGFMQVNDQTLVSAGGEYSDFQYILRILDQLV